MQKHLCIDILIYTYRNVAETLHTTYVWRRESDFIASLVLSAERCELSAAVVGGVRVVLREAHWCAVTGASEVSSNSYLFYTWPEAPTAFYSPKAGWPLTLCGYHFDMFMLCVNAAPITTPFAFLLLPPLPSLPTSLHDLFYLLPGWRSPAQRCPCSHGRFWCSSAPKYGTVRCTSLAPQSTTAPPRTPYSSSSSSSLSAGEGPACSVYTSSSWT